MRVLLSPNSKKELYDFLKTKYSCSSGRSLSLKIKVPYGTLKNWFQEEKRYIPKEIIPLEVINKTKILDEQKDNWGVTKGGRNSYKMIVKKYGISEIRKRQSNGGKKAARLKVELEPLIDNNVIFNPLFLEFYGALLGDGWLSKLNYKKKTIRIIGLCGHISLDREYLLSWKKNITSMFNRDPYIKYIQKDNGMQLIFGHLNLFKFLNENLKFPIGKKENLHLTKDLKILGFENLKYIIRGIFDTDGCFYFDKTPANKPYPCLSITMKEPLLMEQIYSILIARGFKVYHYKSERIQKLILKGSKQLKKWMVEIGSSNPYKFNKMEKALVAQTGLERRTPNA